MPEGLYMYEVNFNATSAQYGLIQVGNSDIEKTFDFSGYKKQL